MDVGRQEPDAGGSPDAGELDSGEVDAGLPTSCEPTSARCPTHVVSGRDVTCALDLSTGTDLIQDLRLEFGSGPDHGIRFVAPETGAYSFWLSQTPAPNATCGVSVEGVDRAFHQISDCPAMGATSSLDGLFTRETDIYQLEIGDEVIVFVGCTAFSPVQSGPYQLRIVRR